MQGGSRVAGGMLGAGRTGAERRFSRGRAGVEIEPCWVCRCLAGRDIPPSSALPRSALPVLAAGVAPKWWVPVPSSVTRVLCWAGGSLTSRGWCKRGRGVLAGTLQGAMVGSHHPRTAPCAGWAQESPLSSFTKGLPVHPLSLQAGGARELLQQGCGGGHTGTTSHITLSPPDLPENATVLACHYQHPGAPLGPEHLSGPGQALLHGD